MAVNLTAICSFVFQATCPCMLLPSSRVYQSLSAHLSVDYTACAPTTEQELGNYFQHKQKLPVTLTLGPKKL